MVLEQISILGNQLELEGYVLQPNGLRTINAFLLLISKSSFFDSQQVQLTRAEISSNEKLLAMKFALTASFAADAATATHPYLAALGARGLAQRVQLLRAQELLP